MVPTDCPNQGLLMGGLRIAFGGLGKKSAKKQMRDRCGAVELRVLDGAMGRVLELN